MSKKSATSQREYHAKFSYVTASVNLKYLLLKQTSTPIYLKAGVGYDYLLGYKQQATVINVVTQEGTKNEFMDFRKSGLNFSLGAGIVIKRASVELTYQRDTMYGKLSANASMGGAVLQLGYRIF